MTKLNKILYNDRNEKTKSNRRDSGFEKAEPTDVRDANTDESGNAGFRGINPDDVNRDEEYGWIRCSCGQLRESGARCHPIYPGDICHTPGDICRTPGGTQ